MSTTPTLQPQQVCFVVDDIPAVVDHCVERYGWGPFYQFKAPVPEASYRDWSGPKTTEVALGMAGDVQVEFIHVHEGHDAVEAYQAEYGTGFQHLGIVCDSRDDAVARLAELGAVLNEQNEYPGIRFAFIDVPTGPAMFELLQRTEQWGTDDGLDVNSDASEEHSELFALDRATIVTDDMDRVLRFYAEAFAWGNVKAEQATLRYGEEQMTARRYIGVAGKLQLELIEPSGSGSDPYSAHLARGSHGLIHAGGQLAGDLPGGASLNGEWLEPGERFALYDWAGGSNGLQMRRS